MNATASHPITKRTPRRHRARKRRSTGDRLLMIGVALTVVALFAAAWISSDAARSSQPLDRITVRAEQGDTPWTLAVRYPVPGLSTAETAALIADENGDLAAGSTVRVPYAADTVALAMR